MQELDLKDVKFDPVELDVDKVVFDEPAKKQPSVLDAASRFLSSVRIPFSGVEGALPSIPSDQFAVSAPKGLPTTEIQNRMKRFAADKAAGIPQEQLVPQLVKEGWKDESGNIRTGPAPAMAPKIPEIPFSGVEGAYTGEMPAINPKEVAEGVLRAGVELPIFPVRAAGELAAASAGRPMALEGVSAEGGQTDVELQKQVGEAFQGGIDTLKEMAFGSEPGALAIEEGLSVPFAVIGAGPQALGTYVLEKTGDPLIAKAAEYGLLIGMFKVGHAGVKAFKARAEILDSIKERIREAREGKIAPGKPPVEPGPREAPVPPPAVPQEPGTVLAPPPGGTPELEALNKDVERIVSGEADREKTAKEVYKPIIEFLDKQEVERKAILRELAGLPPEEAPVPGPEVIPEPPIPGPEPVKAPKPKRDTNTVTGYLASVGRIRISGSEWSDLKVWEEGLAPYFTTKAKGRKGESMKWDKVLMEMEELGILPRGSTLDDLAAAIGREKKLKREGKPVGPPGEEAIEEKGKAFEEERAAQEAEWNIQEISETAIKPGDRFKIEDETYEALRYDEDGFLVIKDGEELRLAPEAKIRVNSGIEGIERPPPKIMDEREVVFDEARGAKKPAGEELFPGQKKEFRLSEEEAPEGEGFVPPAAGEQPEMFPGERAKYRKEEKPPPAPPPEGGLFGGGGGEAAGFAPEKGFRRAPEPEGEAGEVARRSDIVKLLREKFDIPIRTGRIRSSPGVLGIFKIKPEVIRSKMANDIETIAHEIGHALQKFLWPEARNRKGLTGAPFKAYEDELIPIATQARKGVDPSTEGFAEFIRRYVTNPQEAQRVAPRTYAWFDSTLGEKAPEAREILLQARQEYERWLKQPAAARILGQLSIGEKESRPLSFDSVYTKVIDELHPMQMVEEAMAGKDVPAGDSVYKRMRLFAGWRGKATSFLETGTFDYNTLSKTGKSLEEIIRPFREDLDNLRVFILAKRTMEKSGQGIETGILPSDARSVLEQFGTKYDAVWEDLQKYQDSVLKYGVDAGMISKVDYIRMKMANLDYAPFYRVMEDRPGGAGTGKGWEARSPVKGMKGSARDIIDPLESIIKNTYTIINAAEKNAVGQSLVRMAESREGMGKYVEKIPADRKRIAVFEKELLEILRKFGKWTESSQFTQTGQTIRESIREEGAAGENIPPGDRGTKLMEGRAMEALRSRGWTENESRIILNRIKGAKTEGARNTIIEKTIEKTVVRQTVREFGVELPEGLAYIYRNAPWKPAGNVIAVAEKGKVNYYEVHPEVYRVFDALDKEMANALIRLLAKPARLLRAGATLTPEFMGRNPLRDQWSAFLYSKYGYTPIVDAVRGASHLFKKDEIYRLWQISGGEHATLVSMDRDYLQKNLADIVREKTAGKELANVVRHPIDFLRMMSEFGEHATRLGEFAKGIKAEKAAGMGEKAAAMEAAFATREVTLDFARKGSETQAVNMIVAFWNANVQGMDKMVRELKRDPAGITAKAFAAITLPSLLLNLANRKDPRWDDIPQWQKDLFWIVMTENTIWRIPKPFEVGILFGSVPERFLDYALSKDPHAFDDIFKTISRGAAPGAIPTAMNPFIENWANKSSFTDRPVVPRVREQLPPRYQYQPHTTELAKTIGKYVSKLPYLGDSSVASPAKIENLVRGWTGGLGMHVMRIADKALLTAGVNPKRIDPTPTLADNPFTRGFVVRYPSSGGEQVQKFYDNYEKATQTLATSRILLKKELAPEAALEVLSAGTLIKIEGIHKALTNSHRTIEVIYANPDMLPDEKRKLIDTIYLQMRDMAREGNKVLRAIEKTKAGR